MPDSTVSQSVASEREPYYCAVAKTSAKGRCRTECASFINGGQHCGDYEVQRRAETEWRAEHPDLAEPK